MRKCHHTLKKTINQAHLENGTYEQIVQHLERELELNGLEAADELPVNNINQTTARRRLKNKKLSATTAKNRVITNHNAEKWNGTKKQPKKQTSI